MTGRWLELVGGPVRASWRAGLGWAAAFVLLVVSTVAFWPAFEGSPAMTSGIMQMLDQVPGGMLDAFGLRDFNTAAGYLRGGLYEVIVPLMLAAAGVQLASSATAGEEDAGRLELLVAQPVSRSAFFSSRALGVLAWILGIAVVVLVSQLASDAVFDLQIAGDRIVATVVLCTLLGLAHAGLALAIAGLTPRPGLVLTAGLGVALVGYLVAALFPLSDPLSSWSGLSPWDWALGGDPLTNATEGWRYVALAVPAVLLALVGVAGFNRRDVRSA
jgi:ABC-2 type transport system permease protein